MGLDSGRESFVMSLCSRTLIQGCLLSGSWLLRAHSPFFAVPSFVFKSPFHTDFLMSFGQSHMRWSGLSHPKQLLFFFWYSSTDILHMLICSFHSALCFHLFISQRFHSSFSFLLCTGVCFNLIISNGCSLSSECTVVLQLMWWE